MAAALLVSLPGVALAQDQEPVSPEGADWSLTSYYDEGGGENAVVPFEVQPTLRLDDGVASGFAGCNQFSGSYELDGSSLTFGEEMSVTLALCEGPGQLVEDSYLAALGQVGSWSIQDGRLQLYDNLGDATLAFEVPTILWTASQVAMLVSMLDTMQTAVVDLQTEIDTLRDDTDSLNVPRLRERIKVLESENDKIKDRLAKVEDAPTVDPTPKAGSSASFSAAEKVLLEGIPTRIATYCSPLRSSLPKGTRAAVTCRPNTKLVSSVDYYLMEGSQAAAQFGTVMAAFNVPEVAAGGESCESGVKSQRYTVGNGWQAQGCYRENKVAQLRFVDNATDCKKLKVGDKTLGSPAVYIALQASSNDVAGVYDWATRNLSDDSAQLTSITQPIPSKLGNSTSCLT